MSEKKVYAWILSILVIAAIVFATGWENIKITFLKVNLYWLLALFLLQIITLMMIAYRWHYLLRKLYNKISFWKTFNIFLAGSFVESVTPSSKLGGETVKAFLFKRHTSLSYQQLTAILLLDKYFSLLPFALLCILILLWSIFSMQLPWQLYFILPILCVFVITAVRFYHSIDCQSEDKVISKIKKNLSTQGSKKNDLLTLITQKIKRTQTFIRGSIHYSRQLVSARERRCLIMFSLFIWVLYPLKIYMVVYMLNLNTDVISVSIATYIAYLVSIIPLLPGGLGSYEGIMAFMFTHFDLSFAEGISIALLSRLVTFWFPLFLSVGATTYLTLKTRAALIKCES